MTRQILDWLYLITGWLAGAFLFAIFALMMVMSLGRQFGLNVPAGDDFVAWCMAASAFLGLAHTFKRGEMIRVGLLFDKLKGRARTAGELVCLLLGVAVIGYFAWYVVVLARDSWLFGDVAQGVLPVPLWIPQSAMALGLATLFVAFVDETVRVAAGMRPSYAPPDGLTAQDVVERAAHGGH